MMDNPSPDGDVPRTFRFGRLGLAAVLGCSWLWFLAPSTAQDQTGSSRSSGSAGEAVPVGGDEEIVVTARYGEALVEPETELDEQQIAAYGAYSIGDLVRSISRLTGRPDEQPILLINGERVDAVQDLAGYPPAALQRLAILPPEAAGRYGYAGDRRVVNLVLKKHFVSWETQAGLKLPTAGGRHAANLSAGRFVIDGKARWNAQVQLSRESALFRSARGPALPAGDGPNPDDYLSLIPETHLLTATLGLSRPIGPLAGSFSLSAGTNRSRQGLGVVIDDSAGLAVGRLLGRQSSKNLGLAMTLSGSFSGWRTILNANYARDWSNGSIDQPDDAAGAGFVTNRTRARGENLAARLTLGKSIAALPAGPLAANISIGMNRNRSWSRYEDGLAGRGAAVRSGRDRFDGRFALVVPVANRKEDVLAFLGDLSLDIAAGAALGPNEPLQPRIELGANWSPVPALRINAETSFAKLAPAIEQLNAPYREEVRRIYDFARQEIAEPVWVTGGNPELGSGRRRTYALGATLRPFDPRLLMLSVEYRKRVSTGGAGGFPGVTQAVERAFPDRFVRDASGRLTRVDARAIRIVRDTTERLDSAITLSLVPGAKAASSSADPLAMGKLWNLSLALNHGWNLRSELVTSADFPPIDRLRGGTAQSRHNMGLQLVAGRAGFGATLDASWQSGFRLRDIGVNGSGRDYRFAALSLVNLRLHAEPAQLMRGANKPRWLAGLQISLDISNLFDAYRRATLADGSTPSGYERYEVDPLGRTVQLTVRKRF
jgi:hypothetical protein